MQGRFRVCVGSVFLFISLVGPSVSFQTLTVSPPSVQIGLLTPSNVSITCMSSNSPFTVESLTISFSDGHEFYENLATITESNPNATTTSFLPADASVTFTRVYQSTEPKSLTITIPNPGIDDIGRYQCRPTANSSVGSRFVRSVYAELELIPFDYETLNEDLCDLKNDTEILLAEVEAFPEYPPAQNLTGNITEYTMLLDELEHTVNETKDLVETFYEQFAQSVEESYNKTRDFAQGVELSLFVTSEVVNGSFYLLSHFSPISFLNAEDICEGRGGHLAEIDDENEFIFIEFFLRSVVSQQQYVLFGARWNGTDYVNRHSGTQAGYTNFFTGSPNGRDVSEDCLALVLNYRGLPGIKMEDIFCDFIPFGGFDYLHGFLCEVPEQAVC